jgi:hypothetical protein
MEFDQHALEHFTTLARRGKYSGASGGEEKARRLALLRWRRS